MSLTLPTSFKRSNVVENWIVCLGYNEAFDSTTSDNQLAEDLGAAETDLTVDDGSVFAVGDHIRIETSSVADEVVKVTAVNTHVLTLEKGIGSSAVNHNNNDQMFFDNFTAISFKDTQFQGRTSYGVITSAPSIRESISISKSKAKTGNITINLANFKYKGDDFSAELFNGSRAYVNRACKIFLQPDGFTERDDCLLIYTGRLVGFKHNHSSITLNIEARNPWDDVEIPQTKTSKNNYYPVAYGDFRPNASAGSATDPALTFGSSAGIDEYRKRISLYPIPIEERRGATLFALTGEWTQSAKAWPHYYESSNDTFLPIHVDSDGSSIPDSVNETYGDGKAIRFHQNLVKKSFVKLSERTSSGSQTPFAWASNDNAFDGDYINSSTHTQCTVSGNFTHNNKASIAFNMPQMAGYPSTISIHLVMSGSVVLSSASGSGEIRVQLIDESFGASDVLGYYAFTGDATSTTFVKTSGGNLDTSSANYFSNANNSSSEFLASSSGWGEEVKLTAKCVQQSGNLDGDLEGFIRIFDVAVETRTQLDFSATTTSGKNEAYKFLEDLDYVYSGADGLPDNGWNSSAAITEIHEAHRDLLQRFTDFKDSTNTPYGSSNHPVNWSSGTNINSIKDWSIRYWVNNPTLLIKCLETLQYEGGFIGRFNAQGNYQYIFVPDSISTDFTLTKNDVSKFDVSLTKFSDVLTSMDIEYQKHPAKGYGATVAATNSTSITAYNVASNEKKKKVKLNALISDPASSPATNPNDDFYTYYNNLLGEVKHLVNFTLINPYFFGIDVGDFLAFDDIGVDPFGGSWSSRDFIVTSVTRTRGLLKIKAREV